MPKIILLGTLLIWCCCVVIWLFWHVSPEKHPRIAAWKEFEKRQPTWEECVKSQAFLCQKPSKAQYKRILAKRFSKTSTSMQIYQKERFVGYFAFLGLIITVIGGIFTTILNLQPLLLFEALLIQAGIFGGLFFVYRWFQKTGEKFNAKLKEAGIPEIEELTPNDE